MANLELDTAAINSEATKAEQACSAYVRVQVSWNWPGSTRSVKGDLKDEIVTGLEASAESVSASTRMWVWRQPALAAVAALKREASAFVREVTIDWPEDVVRLVPKAKVEAFEQRMREYRDGVRDLAAQVQAARPEVVELARAKRGRAFREQDYPADLSALFDLSWGYSPLTVSEELKEISQSAYAAEKVRHTARVLGAVRMAEEMAVRELHQMAARLAARLTAADSDLPDGETRLPVCGSMVEAVREFCGRFGAVICWGCDDLDEIVKDAGGAVEGVGIDEIKASRELRQRVAESMGAAAARLESILPDLASERPAGTRRAA